MADFSKTDLDRVGSIRKNVEDAEDYFSNNKKRFSEDKSFAFKTTVTTEDRNSLNMSKYPVLDINVIEPYLSRYCGNFYKQSPEIEVRSEDLNVNPDQIDLIEGITRAIFYGSNYKHIAPQVVKDQLCGFSVWEVDVDYKDESSFDKVISLKYVDPLMCGFDPMATGVSKEDARYYYKLHPKTKDELKEEYPNIDFDQINNIPLNMNAGGSFNWKRKVNNRDIYYIADYYEKKYKKRLYYQISDPENPRVTKAISKKEYDNLYPNPDDPLNPEILNKKKKMITSIVRYKIVGNQLLEEPEKIDGKHNRLIFVDGNSVNLDNQQYTRSYFYNVKDSQRIKNRCLSNSIYEMMTLRKSDIFIAEESLPESKDAINAYKDVDRAKGALTYKAFKKDGTPLPPPQVQPRGQLNTQTIQLFEISDRTIQSQFGTYDAQLGLQRNQLSGKAITEGALQSSDVSMPFIINYMASLKQVALVILDLIPIYYTTMRTMPFIEPDGSKSYVTINDPSKKESIMDYNVNSLGVEVEAGPSFDVQRRDSLQTLIQAMGVSESLKQIIDGDGLNILVKNFDIKERQRLLQLVEEHNEKRKKATESQPNPMQIQMQALMADEKRKDDLVELKHQELMLKATKQQQDFMMAVEKLRQSNEKLEEEMMEIKATMILRAEEAKNEADRTQAELAMKQADAIMARERHGVEMLNKLSESIDVDTNYK